MTVNNFYISHVNVNGDFHFGYGSNLFSYDSTTGVLSVTASNFGNGSTIELEIVAVFVE